MKSSIPVKGKKIEDNIIENVQNFSRLKKETDDATMKDVRNLFEHEEEDYYKPVRVGNF